MYADMDLLVYHFNNFFRTINVVQGIELAYWPEDGLR